MDELGHLWVLATPKRLSVIWAAFHPEAGLEFSWKLEILEV